MRHTDTVKDWWDICKDREHRVSQYIVQRHCRLPALGSTVANKADWFQQQIFSKHFTFMVCFSSDSKSLWSHRSCLRMVSSWGSCARGDLGGRRALSSITKGKRESTWVVLHNMKGSSETHTFPVPDGRPSSVIPSLTNARWLSRTSLSKRRLKIKRLKFTKPRN